MTEGSLQWVAPQHTVTRYQSILKPVDDAVSGDGWAYAFDR